jgi:hypothetical protein
MATTDHTYRRNPDDTIFDVPPSIGFSRGFRDPIARIDRIPARPLL